MEQLRAAARPAHRLCPRYRGHQPPAGPRPRGRLLLRRRPRPELGVPHLGPAHPQVPGPLPPQELCGPDAAGQPAGGARADARPAVAAGRRPRPARAADVRPVPVRSEGRRGSRGANDGMAAAPARAGQTLDRARQPRVGPAQRRRRLRAVPAAEPPVQRRPVPREGRRQGEARGRVAAREGAGRAALGPARRLRGRETAVQIRPAQPLATLCLRRDPPGVHQQRLRDVHQQGQEHALHAGARGRLRPGHLPAVERQRVEPEGPRRRVRLRDLPRQGVPAHRVPLAPRPPVPARAPARGCCGSS